MLYFFQSNTDENNPLLINIMLIFLICLFAAFVFYRVFVFVEALCVEYINPRPFFRHFYLRKQKLNNSAKRVLINEFTFYKRLNTREQVFFEHRVANFIKRHHFEGKLGEAITDKKQVLISATAVMLTFGYRNYKINSVERFLVYPDVFYSNMNKAYHKGEYNSRYKAIVFSWKDFLEGYDISNDNFNLAIHEYVHAMHFEYLKTRHRNLSSAIFLDAYNGLRGFLDKNATYKKRLVASRYLRDYAYTNQFEFVAVLIESFMETPMELRQQFPEMYAYVKQMLNFNFADY